MVLAYYIDVNKPKSGALDYNKLTWFEPAILYIDRRQMTITWVPNIKNTHCRPRLHDLNGLFAGV